MEGISSIISNNSPLSIDSFASIIMEVEKSPFAAGEKRILMRAYLRK